MDSIAPSIPFVALEDTPAEEASSIAPAPVPDGEVEPLGQPPVNTDDALANGVQLATSTSLPPASTQLYSPTKHEIDSHPIRQRLSTVRDDISTTLGSAPAADDEKDESRQDPQLSQPNNPLPRAMADTQVKEGDQVSWQWSGGRPGGEATEVKEQGEMSMTTKRGNEVKKNADPENPAVKISRSGQDVVKRASELDVEEAGDKHKEGEGEKATEGESKKNGEEAHTGEKRSADDEVAEKKDEGKKQKKDEPKPKENGEKAPKKKGRPAKSGGGAAGAKKETKKREPKKAATESGEPRRSGRNAK